MRKIRLHIHMILSLAFIVSFLACDDEYDRAKGPTDIRIRNISTFVYDSILVNTSGGENTYGTLNADGETQYKRFDYAFPDADITLYINSVEYTYGPVDYTHAAWLGTGKYTYEVDVADTVAHTLSMDVIPDSAGK